MVVAFQGGEPTLMGLEFMRRHAATSRSSSAVPGQQGAQHPADQRDAARRRVGRVPAAEHGFLVGLSIDGPREMHDAYRVDKGGKPTFDRVLRGLGVLQRHGRRLERPHHRQRGQR